MDTDLLIIAIAFISVTGIIAKTVIRMHNARLTAGSSDELKERVEELESTVQGLQRELAEAQERIDFAERLLAKGSGQS